MRQGTNGLGGTEEKEGTGPMSPATTAETPQERRAFSVSTLAADYSVSKQTIYREIEEGRLRAKRVRGRLVIPREAVEEWLASE